MQHVIEMSSVNKHYPHFSLRNVNLQLPAGEIMGLVGVNGAGKSTLMKIISGYQPADSGTITLDEQDPGRSSASVDPVKFPCSVIAYPSSR